MKKLLMTMVMGWALLLALASPTMAQVGVPYVFVADTDILSAEVNANFDALATSALKRDGSGNITGNVTVDANVTIDGADISDYLDGSGNVTVPGTLGVTGVATFTATPVLPASVTIRGVTYSFPSAAAGTNGYVLNSTTGSALSWSSAESLLVDKTLTRPKLLDYTESKSAPSISAGTLTLDLANGNHFAVSLNANVSTLTFSNVPSTGQAVGVVVLFTADGTLRTISWPASVKWAGASAPTMTSTNGKTDIVTLYTVDGGTTWYAVLGGQNF